MGKIIFAVDLRPRISTNKAVISWIPRSGIGNQRRLRDANDCDVSMTTKSHIRLRLSEAADI